MHIIFILIHHSLFVSLFYTIWPVLEAQLKQSRWWSNTNLKQVKIHCHRLTRMLWSSSGQKWKLVWRHHSYSHALCHLVSFVMMPLALSYRHLAKHFLTWGGWWDRKSTHRSVWVGCHHPFRVGCQGMREFHPSRKHPKESLLKESTSRWPLLRSASTGTWGSSCPDTGWLPRGAKKPGPTKDEPRPPETPVDELQI